MSIDVPAREGDAILVEERVYELNIEGRGAIRWERNSITVAEIITLGGWETTVTVIEVDHENNERTLAVDEVIFLKEKHSFGKKHHWKRG